jgi:hypothetical protein
MSEKTPEVKAEVKVEPSVEVAAPYKDPFQEMYEGKNEDLQKISARGSFASSIYAQLVGVRTSYVLGKEEINDLSLDQYKMIAKQAVYGADILLAELARTNNRRV